MSTNEQKEQASKELQYLKDTLVSGDNLFITLVKISESGMTRYLKVQFSPKRGEYLTLTYSVGRALGYTIKDMGGDNCIVMKGYGYSASDEIRRDLSMLLFGECDKLTTQGSW